MDQDTDSLIGEGEKKKSYTMQSNHLPSPMSILMPRQSPHNGHLGNQAAPHLSSSSPVLMLTMMLYAMEFPFEKIGTAVPVNYQFLSDTQLTLCGGMGVHNGKGKTIDAVQTLFNCSQNTDVLSILI